MQLLANDTSRRLALQVTHYNPLVVFTLSSFKKLPQTIFNTARFCFPLRVGWQG
jgi:hypothetical protein